ncbi:MAG: hypothetical protein JST92_13930, partial [Deltaproteobacteria bacterium]|nr:hypothetical protein [Deltaproteobacteria bacterium]
MRLSGLRWAVVVASLCALHGPVRAEDEDDELDNPVVERDNPNARRAARALLHEVRTPEEQLHILEVAAQEARKYGIGQHTSARESLQAAAVGGQVWVNLGPDQAAFENNGITYNEMDSGRLRSIVPHPLDPNILYVATSGGGVWKTYDATTPVTTQSGPHWVSITDGVGALATGALALDPRSPDTLILGLGDPFDVQEPGVITSADGGVSWSPPVLMKGNQGSGTVTATSVRNIVVDPSGTNVVLAATNAGLFRSTQGGLGDTWTLLDPFPNHRQLDCWSVAYVGTQTWLVACQGVVLRSTDGGASFADLTGALPNPNPSVSGPGRMTLAASAVDQSTPNNARVYLLAADAYGGQQKDVYWSGNGGQTWNSLGMYAGSGNKPRNVNSDQGDLDVLHDQAWYNQAIIADPRDHNVVFVGGNLSLIRTRDGGANWDVISNWLPRSPLIANQYNLPYIHADWHAMAVSTAGIPKGLPAVFFGGTDGGLFMSQDQPTTKCQSGSWIYCSAFTAPPGYNGNTVPPGSANTPIDSPTFTSKMNRGIASLLAYSIATDEHDAGSSLVMGGFQDNGTRLRAGSAAGPASTFNQVIGGDGFGVGIGISTSASTPSSCVGKMGSVLVGTVYANVYRSIDCGNSFSSSMQGICASPNGPLSGCSNGGAGPCCVDLGSNFYMKIATDFSD